MTHTTYRNRHNSGFHIGDLPATAVELSSAIAGVVGDDIEDAIRWIDQGLSRLESADIVISTATIDCVIARGHWTVDACIMPVFTVDACIMPVFTVDACIMPVFTVDACIMPVFTVDAVVQ